MRVSSARSLERTSSRSKHHATDANENRIGLDQEIKSIRTKVADFLVADDLFLLSSACQLSSVAITHNPSELVLGILQLLEKHNMNKLEIFMNHLIRRRIEVYSKKNSSMRDLLRDNSITVLLVTTYARRVSTSFLCQALQPALLTISPLLLACEINPAKLPEESTDQLKTNTQNLLTACETLLSGILAALDKIPPEILRMCRYIREQMMIRRDHPIAEEAEEPALERGVSGVIGAQYDGPQDRLAASKQIWNKIFSSNKSIFSASMSSVQTGNKPAIMRGGSNMNLRGDRVGSTSDKPTTQPSFREAIPVIPERESWSDLEIVGGTFLILRFFVPAMTTPEKFDLKLDPVAMSGASINSTARRGLVYISKSFTALCNHKSNADAFNEEFMAPMSKFLERKRGVVKEFILNCMEGDEEEDTPMYPETDTEPIPEQHIECDDVMMPFLAKCVPRMRKDISLAVTLPNGATFFQPSTVVLGTNAISAGTLMSGSLQPSVGPGPLPRQINNNTWETNVGIGTYIPGLLTPASSFRIPASQASLCSAMVKASEQVCQRALRNLEMVGYEIERWEEIQQLSKVASETAASIKTAKRVSLWTRIWRRKKSDR